MVLNSEASVVSRNHQNGEQENEKTKKQEANGYNPGGALLHTVSK